MKKLTLFFTALMLAVVAAFGVTLAACQTGEKLDYTVIVLNEDETEGVENVTVKWSDNGVKGTAKTDAEGKATANLTAATYEVTLEDLPEGYTCGSATVTAGNREITLSIEKAKVDYTVFVLTYDGSAASGVKVTWWDTNNVSVAEKTTDENGKATAKLVYGDYSVTIDNTPLGNIYLGSQSVTGSDSNATFNMEQGNIKTYSVTVITEGELLFKDYTVFAYNGERVLASAKTNENGVATLNVPDTDEVPAVGCTLRVQNLPDGYTQPEVTLTEETNVTITLHSEVINKEPVNGWRYHIGDIIHDYEFTTPYELDGAKKTVRISELLKTKKVVLLNFWGTGCSNCDLEMPYMQTAYEKYKDDAEIIAINNYIDNKGGDKESDIIAYYNRNKYTFPMVLDATKAFVPRFNLSGWPTTVVIDRYGAIARIEEGALLTNSAWDKVFSIYLADDYKQTFIPGADVSDSTIIEMARPNVKVEEGHYEKVAETINGTLAEDCAITWEGEPEATAEFTWPFMLKEDDGATVLYPSNTAHDNTYSFIYANITMSAGKVFAFDYWVNTEEDLDTLNVFADSTLLYTISGNSQGWQTCYVYFDIIRSTHRIALCYLKDEELGPEDEKVYIKNARFEEFENVNWENNILRGAAYGTPAAGEKTYPNYAEVTKLEDGYYYVDRDKLVGAAYAGNDATPMLFANMMSATNWNRLSINQMVYAENETGDKVFDTTFEYKGETKDWRELLIDYVSLSNKSAIAGYLPVDDDLRELLVAFTAHISGDDKHDKEWLELCYFFSHYGDDEPVRNTIIGITDSTAVQIKVEEKITADLNRFVAPFPMMRYKFTIEKSGVYEIKSFIDNNDTAHAAQVWVYTNDIERSLLHSGTERFVRGAVNEHNFDSFVYLEQGTQYYIAVAFSTAASDITGTLEFSISYYGDSATVLVPGTSAVYYFVGEDENNTELTFAVKYKIDDEGYYRVANKDGSFGDYLYVDFTESTIGYQICSIEATLNQWVTKPDYVGSDKKVPDDAKVSKVWDFSKVVDYKVDSEGNPTGYTIWDLSKEKDKEKYGDYQDYTDRMTYLCEKAKETEGEMNGTLKIKKDVNDDIIKILSLAFRLRADSVQNGIIPKEGANDWLGYCWYHKTIDANNPV